MKKRQQPSRTQDRSLFAGRLASFIIEPLIRLKSGKKAAARVRKAEYPGSRSVQRIRMPEWFAAQVPVVKQIGRAHV